MNIMGGWHRELPQRKQSILNSLQTDNSDLIESAAMIQLKMLNKIFG